MVFIDNKNLFFSFLVVIRKKNKTFFSLYSLLSKIYQIFLVIVRNSLSEEKQNISKLYNESNSIEIITGNSSLKLTPTVLNSTLKGQTNGRMRSFLVEDEEEEGEELPLKIFGKYYLFLSFRIKLSEKFSYTKNDLVSLYSRSLIASLSISRWKI